MGIAVGLILTAVVEAVQAAAAFSPALTAIVTSAVTSAISYTISALTMPKPPGPLSQGIDRVRNIQRDPQAPGRVYYGHGFGSGYLVYATVTDIDGKQREGAIYLHICLIVAVGPIAGISKYHLNDEDNIATFGDLISFVPFAGTWDQPMFRGPVGIKRKIVALPQEWLKENRPLSGIAYVWATMAAHPTVFPGGPPAIRMEIDGAIIYDPRSPAQNPDDPYTWEFSNNWAVCVYNYLTNKEYGRGARHEQICPDCFLEAASWSDTDTPAPSAKEHDDSPTPTIKRYTVDGSFETNEQPVDIMTTLAAAAAGTITFYDGQWHIRAGMPRATLLDIVTGKPIILTPDNLREDEQIQINVRPGRKESANIVRGSFVSPKEQFTVQDFPEQTHPDFVKEDGGVELITNLELPYCTDVDRAQRLARISLYMSRLGLRVTFPGGPELLQIPPWEVVELAFPDYGWGKYNVHGDVEPNIVDPTAPAGTLPSYKQFYVADRQFNEDGGINLVLAEYSNAMYSDTINPALLPVRSGLPNPFEVFPPQNVLVKELVHIWPDGTRVSKLRLTWEPPLDGYADFYVVNWRNINGLDPFMSRVLPGDALLTEIIDLAVGTYEVQIRTRVLNHLSTPVIVYGNITYVTAPPPDPTNFRVSINVTDTRQFSWDVVGGVEPPDLRGYEIRFVKTDTPTSVIPAWDDARRFLRSVRRRTVETRQPVAEGTYTFLLKSVDLTGLYSKNYAVAQITIKARDVTVLANREYSEDEWPGTKADCAVNERNQLVGTNQTTWDTAPTWATMGTWAGGKMRLVYTPPPLTLSASDFVTLEFKVEGQGIDGFYVQTRARNATSESFSAFAFVTGITGREFQFRLIAWNAGTTPLVIDRFYVTITTKDQTDRLDGILISQQATKALQRIEDTAALASTGEVTHIDATIKGITTPRRSWARMDSTGYITVPFTETLILDATYEITVHVQTPAAWPARIFGRGTDWGIDYTQETVGGKTHGIFRFNATGYPAGGIFSPIVADIGEASIGIHDISISIDAGTISMYVNKRFIGKTGPVGLAFSSNPVAIGARVVGGTVDQYAGIMVKECRVWRWGLTADEVAMYSGVIIDPATPGLLGYWRLDDDYSTTTVVRDRAAFSQNPGVANGTVSPHYLGGRMSPPINLGIIPTWNNGVQGKFTVVGTPTVATMVYMGIGVGDNPPLKWTQLTANATVNIDGSLIPNDTGPQGRKLWCFQSIRVGSLAVMPTISSITTIIGYKSINGELVVQPPHAFSEIRQGSLTIHSDSIPLGWYTVARDPIGMRFVVFNSSVMGPADATVDVLFYGSRIPAYS